MIRKWIPAGLTLGLMAAAITGGAVLASGGDEDGTGQREAEEVVVKDEDVSTSAQELSIALYHRLVDCLGYAA